MRVLCVNANTTESITQRVGDEMRRTFAATHSGSSIEVIDCTPTFGPSVIMTRLDLSVATHAVVDTAAMHSDFDAIMLAVSFDTGRDALREALSVPVIGMSEASVAMARLAGGKLGYVSIGADITPLYWENLDHCHMQADIAGWETIEAPAAYKTDSFEESDGTVLDACHKLAAKGADVAVLMGAVLAGAAHRIQERSPIPVVDGGAAGALMIRSITDLKLPKPKTGTFAKRTGGDLSGVNERLIALQD